MPEILKLWLNEVPQYTVLFARMALIAGMVDTLTLGLSVTNEAIGNIRNYNLVISTLKLTTLPLIWVCLYFHLDLVHIPIVYIAIELLSACARIPFLHKTGGLNLVFFVKNNLIREFVALIILIVIEFVLVYFLDFSLRFLITIPVSVTCYTIAMFFIGLNPDEKKFLMNLFNKKRN